MLERRHGTLKTMLTKTNKRIAELLGPLLLAYRESVHESTGFIPFWKRRLILYGLNKSNEEERSDTL